MDVSGFFDAFGERHTRVSGSRWFGDRQRDAVAIHSGDVSRGAEPATAQRLCHEQDLIGQLLASLIDEVSAEEYQRVGFGTSDVGRAKPALVAVLIGESDPSRFEPQPRPIERLDGAAQFRASVTDCVSHFDLLNARNGSKIALNQQSTADVHARTSVASAPARVCAEIRHHHHGNAGGISDHRHG